MAQNTTSVKTQSGTNPAVIDPEQLKKLAQNLSSVTQANWSPVDTSNQTPDSSVTPAASITTGTENKAIEAQRQPPQRIETPPDQFSPLGVSKPEDTGFMSTIKNFVNDPATIRATLFGLGFMSSPINDGESTSASMLRAVAQGMGAMGAGVQVQRERQKQEMAEQIQQEKLKAEQATSAAQLALTAKTAQSTQDAKKAELTQQARQFAQRLGLDEATLNATIAKSNASNSTDIMRALINASSATRLKEMDIAHDESPNAILGKLIPVADKLASDEVFMSQGKVSYSEAFGDRFAEYKKLFPTLDKLIKENPKAVVTAAAGIPEDVSKDMLDVGKWTELNNNKTGEKGWLVRGTSVDDPNAVIVKDTPLVREAIRMNKYTPSIMYPSRVAKEAVKRAGTINEKKPKTNVAVENE